MELQLGLGLPGCDPSPEVRCSFTSLPPWLKPVKGMEKKRRWEDSFWEIDGDRKFPRTLPLLVWDTKQPDEEDGSSESRDRNDATFASNKIQECDGLVGWPPVKIHTRRLSQHPREFSKMVKVKMEGVAIARKIDLTAYTSLPNLKHDLLEMFGVGEENSRFYQLACQGSPDREWLVVEDNIDWGIFTALAHRLKLVKEQPFNQLLP